MDAEMVGDKGKLRNGNSGEASKERSEEAIWAITLTKALWKKGIW